MQAEVYIPPVMPVVTLKFEKPYEARNLLEELTTWAPAGGWSSDAHALFSALREAANPDD
jgi:hypothetical protein